VSKDAQEALQAGLLPKSYTLPSIPITAFKRASQNDFFKETPQDFLKGMVQDHKEGVLLLPGTVKEAARVMLINDFKRRAFTITGVNGIVYDVEQYAKYLKINPAQIDWKNESQFYQF